MNADQITEKWWLFLAIGAGWIAAAEFGYVTGPAEIEGIGIVFTGIAAAGIAGYLAAGKVEGLLPDPEGIYLIAFNAADESGGELWELSEDQFSDMTVEAGTLFEWPTGKRVYEARSYDPETNTAVANWRESVAGSQLAGDTKVIEALDQITELRNEFEPEARKSRRLQRRIRSIVRKLDRRRLEDQQQILDPETTPSFADRDHSTVSQVVAEELPDDLKPESMKQDQTDQPETENVEGETVGFDLLDESEPLRNDGGTE